MVNSNSTQTNLSNLLTESPSNNYNIRMKRRSVLVFLILTSFLIPSVNAFAEIPKKITTCANKKSGALRLANICKKSETKVQWNQSGINGSTIHNGPTLPNTEDDQTPIGDYFLVTSTMVLYGPKTEKGWPAEGFKLQGPAGGGGGPQGPKGDKGDPGITLGYYGYFYDTTTLTLSTTGQALQYNTRTPDDPYTNGVLSNGVTIVDNALNQPTRITLSNAGKYNIAFSSQLYNPGKKTNEVTIWLKKNGLDIINSSTDMFLGTGIDVERRVAAWNFFVSAAANDYFEIFAIELNAYADPNDNVKIYSGTSANPGVPAIPGTILTVNQVG